MMSWKEFKRKHATKIRFVVVGIWNTLFGYGIFIGIERLLTYVFEKRSTAYMTAMVLSNIFAIINAFIFHKRFTFQSQTRGIAVVSEFIRFSTTYVFTFFLSLILLPVFVEIFLVTPEIGGALVILICTVVSYVGHTKFSFSHEPGNQQ